MWNKQNVKQEHKCVVHTKEKNALPVNIYILF